MLDDSKHYVGSVIMLMSQTFSKTNNSEVEQAQNGQVMLAVTSFGGFSISAVDALTGEVCAELADNRGNSQKMQLMVAYLIFSGKEAVSFDELIEVLWPEDGPEDPLAALRLLVHRARIELDKLGVYSGSKLIIRKNKSYCWNGEIPVIRDSERFDELYNKSGKGSAGERLASLLEAAKIYRGHFLPKSIHYQWVMVLDTYYHSKYMAVCEEAVRIMEEFGNHREIIDLCKNAVTLDPYAEPLHIALLKALAEVGSYSAALEHYRHVTEMFMDEFGIAPSDALKTVYGKLLKGSNALGSDIGTIRQALTDYDGEGAFFMEYEIFRHVYWLKSRESMRSGQVVQLVLITAAPSGGMTPGQRSRRTCMERLGDVIQNSLRQGDLYTRYSVLQYLVMVQSANYENCQVIIDRIQRGFKLSYPRSGYLLQFSMLPLLPKRPSKDGGSTSIE